MGRWAQRGGKIPKRKGKGGGRPAYALYRLALAGIRTLPHSWAVVPGRWLGRMAWVLDRRHRRVVLENLETAFPEWSLAERRRVGRACFAHFGFALFDTLSASRFDAETYLARIRVAGIEHLREVEEAGRGMLALTAHLGCWEAANQWMALAGYRVGAIFRPLDNPYLDGELKQLRERFGNPSIPKRAAAREALRTLKRKGRVGILVDQRVHPNDGEALPFFGRPAYTSPLPAQLSLRTGAPVLPIFALPEGSRGYRIEIRPAIWPEEVEGEEEPETALSLRYLAITEAEIRRRPELWLWMHRRWRVNPVRSLRGRGLKRSADKVQDEVP